MGNFALPLPPADQKTGEGGGARRRPRGLGGGHREGEKGERAMGTRFPVLPRAGTARGGGATRAGGGGWRWSQRWHCKARKGRAGAERVRGGAEARQGSLYSRGKAVEGGGIGGGRLAAINGARGIVERRDA